VSVFTRFAPRLQQAIVARLGWSSLRPVQEQAGHALLDGMNAIILAPTAGGKTEAAIFPTLSQLIEHPTRSVGALYVAPLRALLNNQAERLATYTDMVGLRRFVWHGDTSDHHRRRFLADPTELLMTTPESLEVMLISKRVDELALFSDLRVIIIDEIHALAGTDRGTHLISVTERLASITQHDLQRAGLSATVGNPDTIATWLTGTSARPATVIDPPAPPKRRRLTIIHRDELDELARLAARTAKNHKSLFFCQTRAATEAAADAMRHTGTSVFVHHSAVSREERQRAEAHFSSGTDACIVCTSTLELGIDVGDLDHVLQAEAPTTVSAFLQRMGRTGRREGQTPNTTFLAQSSEAVLLAMALIELAKRGYVERVELDPRSWPVLIHQTLAMALAKDGVTREDAHHHHQRVPDFSGITRDEYDRLIDWMLHDQALRIASGRLVLGPKAEHEFGRKNFMELYAVFTSPSAYTVQLASTGQPLGTLEQAFVDRLSDGVSTFLLAGRPWAVNHIQHDDRRVIVQPATSAHEPTWGGYLPQFLSLDITRTILDILTNDQRYPYLDPNATQVLHDQRDSLRGILTPDRGGTEIDTREIRWWTFAGGHINTTLRYAIEATRPHWTVTPDNYMLRVRGPDRGVEAFRATLDRLHERDLWDDTDLWSNVAASLPSYRLSKFQALMPPWVEQEIIARYLLDTEGTYQWLRQRDEAGRSTEHARNRTT
jgi:ATP-dependent helicase Lhr and Lhr-like helicase